MLSEIRVDGRVVKLVSDDELVINLGSIDGVRRGDLFRVLDSQTMELTDPETGENLGGIARALATVQVTNVAERVAVAAVHPRRASLSDIGSVLTGTSRPRRTLSDGWPEGVGRGDPIMRVETAEPDDDDKGKTSDS